MLQPFTLALGGNRTLTAFANLYQLLGLVISVPGIGLGNRLRSKAQGLIIFTKLAY